VSLNALVGLEKVSLHQCEELAKKLGFDSLRFDLVGPKGRKHCRWLDAYFGLFQIDGEDTAICTNQLTFVPDIWCENLQFGESSEIAPTAQPTEKS
jgi:hypothetical protein